MLLYPFAFPKYNFIKLKTDQSWGWFWSSDLLVSSELVFAQDLNHRLTEHRGHGGEAEGEAGGQDRPEAVHDEAVEAAEAVHRAQHHVQTADNDGGDTAEEKLGEMMGQMVTHI